MEGKFLNWAIASKKNMSRCIIFSKENLEMDREKQVILTKMIIDWKIINRVENSQQNEVMKEIQIRIHMKY